MNEEMLINSQAEAIKKLWNKLREFISEEEIQTLVGIERGESCGD